MRNHSLVRNYFLMHRRFAHFGTAVAKLHKVTTHSKVRRPNKDSILVMLYWKDEGKKINRGSGPHRDDIPRPDLNRVCGPLPFSLAGDTPLPTDGRQPVPEGMGYLYTKDENLLLRNSIFGRTVELQTNKRLKTVRLDNIKELLSTVNQWVKRMWTDTSKTHSHISHQNGIAEEVNTNNRGIHLSNVT